ncbi:MAG: flavodoxin family protein [Chloroflexota bacterium]|nr:flavodoxin family protein [Chloroflexota bacterium]
MVKVVAVNGSPKMDKGNTHAVLEPFLEGMKEAGAEVELFYIKKLKVKPCQGGFICWNKTPGECWQKDDMQWLGPKMGKADIWVFATPVYVDGVSGPLKMLLDRLIPLVHGPFERRDNHCRHPLREEYVRGKLVLVSNCGFWEMDNFDPLVVHMQAACKNMSREYAGALLRPHGGAMRVLKELGSIPEDVVEAARDAGRQLVRDGKMKPETLATVSRELVPFDMYFDMASKGLAPTQETVKS